MSELPRGRLSLDSLRYVSEVGPACHVIADVAATSLAMSASGTHLLTCWGEAQVELETSRSRTRQAPQDHLHWAEVEFKRISLTGFRSCASRSRYQSISKQTTRLIHLESHKSPTKSLFDVGTRRISIVTVNTKEYHSDVLIIITRIIRRTY
ncbi:hypothetical protein Tco_0606372 [Tanacetum coccineum]